MFFLSRAPLPQGADCGGLENPGYGLPNRQVHCLIHHAFTCGDGLSPEVLSPTIYKEPCLKGPLP